MDRDRYSGWDSPSSMRSSSMAQLGSPFSNGSQYMPYRVEFVDHANGRRVVAHLTDEQLYNCYQEFCIRHPDILNRDRNQREINERVEKEKEVKLQVQQNLKLLL